MALDKQLVPIDFTGGVDSRTNRHLVIPGKLLGLTNARFDGGTISKRAGSDALPRDVTGGGTLTDAEAAAVFRGELLRWSGGNLYAYASTNGTWGLRGSEGDASTFLLSKQQVHRSLESAQGPSCACAGGYTAFVWRAASRVRASVVDANGDFILRDVDMGHCDTAAPRVVALGGDFLFLWTSGTSLLAASFNSLSPTAISAPVTFATNVYSGGLFGAYLDAVATGPASGAIVYTSGTGTTLGLFLFGPSTTGSIAATSVNSLALAHDSATGNLLVVYSRGTGVYLRRLNASLTPLAAEETVGAAAGTERVALAEDSGTFHVFAHSATGAGSTLYRGNISASGVGATLAAWRGNLAPAGHGFALAGRLLLPVIHRPSGTDVQPTLFVVDVSSGRVVARALAGLAGGGFIGVEVGRAAVNGDGEAVVPALERGRLVFGRGYVGEPVDRTPDGISALTLRPAQANEVPRFSLGSTLHVGGALPQVYDGVSLVEDGFHLSPDGLSYATSGTGSVAVGTYQYRAVYEWLDAQGQLHRSAPSPALTVTLAAPGSATVSGAYLPLSRRASPRSPVVVRLYRSEANASGEVLYRVSSLESPALNSVSGTAWSITDSAADASILTGEILYTAGGVLEAFPPPAYSVACVHGKRLCVVNAEDPQEVRYSTEYVPGEAVYFSEELRLRVPESAGPVTGLASMDGKLIFWTPKDILVTTGDGPNATGAANSFSEPQSLQSDVGCADWRSIIETPNGYVFLSKRGLYLLGRGFDIAHVGADVSEFTDDWANGDVTFRCATVLEDTREVRFHFDANGDTDGEAYCLTWNYERNQWSVSTDFGAVDCLLYGGDYLRVRSDGHLLREGPGFDDAGDAYALNVETAWLKPMALQGAQRVYRALLLGRFASDCTLTLQAFYDYDEGTVGDTVTVVITDATQTGGVFQVEHPLSRQRCEAVRFRITVEAEGEGVALTNMSLRMGFKPGSVRLPATRRI